MHLASYEDGEVIYIDKYDSTHPVRMYSRIGRRAPLHCTAVAKVLLADLPEPQLHKVVDGMEFTAADREHDHQAPPPTSLSWTGCAAGVRGRQRRARGLHPLRRRPDPRSRAARCWPLCRCRCPRCCSTSTGLLGHLPDLLATAEAASVECGYTPR